MRRFLDSLLTRASQRQSTLLILLVLASLLVLRAEAAPGAHGPDGEHLDQKAASTSGAVRPRLEAHTELFELVAERDGQQLTVLIDRYETNEPVLTGTLEIESGAIKASARFQPESGAFVVTDKTLLAALATPGEHALVFTLMTGNDADLLDGTLVVADPDAAGHGHRHSHVAEAMAWGLLVLALLAVGVFWIKRRRQARALSGRSV